MGQSLCQKRTVAITIPVFKTDPQLNILPALYLRSSEVKQHRYAQILLEDSLAQYHAA